MRTSRFSPARVLAIFIKEVQQMLRDRPTFAMAVGVPILQLLLFGYAINTDPKGLPTAVVTQDRGPMARSLVAALEQSGYFRVQARPASEREGDTLVEDGEVQFLIVIPPDFSRRVIRGEQPAVLVSVDATDPSASSNALGALAQLGAQALRRDLVGAARPNGAFAATNAAAASTSAAPGGASPALPFEWRIHRRYNPEGLSRYNIVPGLIGTILPLSMVMLPGLARTRERPPGTMENLLATPVRPLEVMIGKILPYIVLGYVQLGMILLAAALLFRIPMAGSFMLLLTMIGVFMLANLAVGFTFSTLAKNQLQALQATFFFFLPSMLLSGFMFPFRGMPRWAQVIGEALPLTHFLRIVRGIMLKGNSFQQLVPELWPMLIFLLVAGTIALLRYRQTLD